jgi:hypothetical protein
MTSKRLQLSTAYIPMIGFTTTESAMGQSCHEKLSGDGIRNSGSVSGHDGFKLANMLRGSNE